MCLWRYSRNWASARLRWLIWFLTSLGISAYLQRYDKEHRILTSGRSHQVGRRDPSLALLVQITKRLTKVLWSTRRHNLALIAQYQQEHNVTTHICSSCKHNRFFVGTPCKREGAQCIGRLVLVGRQQIVESLSVLFYRSRYVGTFVPNLLQEPLTEPI